MLNVTECIENAFGEEEILEVLLPMSTRNKDLDENEKQEDKSPKETVLNSNLQRDKTRHTQQKVDMMAYYFLTTDHLRTVTVTTKNIE